MITSKHAPKTPLQSLALSRAQKLAQEKEKVKRLLIRLSWKAELLLVSYHRALETTHIAHAVDAAHQSAISMFKIDFFEFYTFLERYITTCLSVFGYSISASAPRTNVNALRYITNPGLHRTRPVAEHAFHANILAALDNENCPLHGTLGLSEVRGQLGVAKDYRNAWKDADARSSNAKMHLKMQDLHLQVMLRILMNGCNQSHIVVMGHDHDDTDLTSKDFESQMNGYSDMDMDMEDLPFEYMDDAMELD